MFGVANGLVGSCDELVRMEFLRELSTEVEVEMTGSAMFMWAILLLMSGDSLLLSKAVDAEI